MYEEKQDNENKERVQGTFWCTCERCKSCQQQKHAFVVTNSRSRKTRWNGLICTRYVVIYQLLYVASRIKRAF